MNKPAFVLTAGLILSAGLTAAQAPLVVGIAYNTGGKNDRSFNQRAAEGMQRVEKDFGVTVKEFAPADPNEMEKGIEDLAANGANFVIGVGFSNEPGVTAAAKAHPDAKFAVLDSVPTGKNTLGLVFREQEGSFVVGYIAGKSTSTGVIGFVGGMNIPLIHKFDAGFAAGVKAACPKCTVLSSYIGTTPSAWNDPSKAKEIAAGYAKKGADIIYAAAGASGAGVQGFVTSVKCLSGDRLPAGVRFGAVNIASGVPKAADYTAKCGANTRPLFFIGVDSNQNYLGDTDNNPTTMNHGLVSMEKRLDNVVYSVIGEMKRGAAWTGGVREFGLKEQGVGYALDEYNKALIPQSLVNEVARIKERIITGKISVPTK